MARRLAVVIGNATFGDAQAFPTLRTPVNDARQFAAVLQKYGQFEILDLLLDENRESVETAIERLFKIAERDDLTLLYYSGHGYKAPNGRLYLAAKNTLTDLVRTTGIWEEFIRDASSESRARQQVIVLDCCFSGTLIAGRMAGEEQLALNQMQGDATAILASSGRIQYSFEERGPYSLFTQYLLQGIETGEADVNQDGRVEVRELFAYAEWQVRQVRREQTPVLRLTERVGKLVLAEIPEELRQRRELAQLYEQAGQDAQAGRWQQVIGLFERIHTLQADYPDPQRLERQAHEEIDRQLSLPSELIRSVASSLPWERLGAVSELEKLMESGPPQLIKLAYETLEKLTADDSLRVRDAAQKVLDVYSEHQRKKDQEKKLEAVCKPAQELLSLKLVPAHLSSLAGEEGIFRVEVTNRSNKELRVQLEASDRDGQCVFWINPAQAYLRSMEDRQVQLRVGLAPSIPIAETHIYPITITARIEGISREPVQVRGVWELVIGTVLKPELKSERPINWSRLWLLWVLANCLGWFLGAIIGLLVNGLPFDTFGSSIINGFILGAIIGFAQWTLLRRWIGVSFLWVLVSAVGSIVYALGMGILQGLVFQRQIQRSLWIRSYLVGLLLGVIVVIIVNFALHGYPDNQDYWLIVVLHTVAGCVVGMVSGFMNYHLLNTVAYRELAKSKR